MQKEDFTLADLYTFWYGHPKKINFSKSTLKSTNFSPSLLEEIWKSKWFAKNEEQMHMDEYLTKYEDLLKRETEGFEETFNKSDSIFEHISRVILFDQIPRNIYRNSAKAYEFDEKARAIVKKYLLPKLLDFPLHVICTALICLIHSEDVEDQEYVKKEIDFLKESYREEFIQVISMLSGIHKNHMERVQLFGRIPERNVYLGRESTPAEISYIVQMNPSIVVRCTPFKF
jgi:uncharacterized protein (DUF924 family)